MSKAHVSKQAIKDAFLSSQIDTEKRRSAFIEVQAGGPRDDNPWYGRRALLEAAIQIEDPIPDVLCAPLGVPIGSVYKRAAIKALLREGRELGI